MASPCHTTRSKPSVQFCSDAVRHVQCMGCCDSDALSQFFRIIWQAPKVQQLWSCHFAVESTLATEDWIRLPRFVATDLDGFNKWHRQIVKTTDSCLSINKLPHYERCGLIWHHESNLVMRKCKQFWYCVNTQYRVYILEWNLIFSQWCLRYNLCAI